jgi:serine/threonine protein kinase
MDASSPYCPKCGALNTPGAATCFACQESLVAPLEISAAAAVTLSPRPTIGLGLPGQLLRGRYRLVRRVGEGGFGAVYLAEDTDLGNRRVAIKEMSQNGLRPDEVQEATDAFRHEALLLAGLAHPSLPRIYEHFTEDGHWYLVMEYIEGETLETYLAKRGGRLSVAKALDMGIKICGVLEYLHGRQPPVVFRDLKPGNVMLTPEGQIYLIDFGIARFFTPGKAHDTIAFGSPGYAAPEQYGKAQTSPRSDVFSLGALLHQLLTGDDPSKTPFRFVPLTMSRPPGTWTLIRQMVELDEYKRPPNIASVRHVLERLTADWEAGRQGSRTGYVGGPATGTFPVVGPPPHTSAYPAPALPPLPPKPYPTAMFPPGPPTGAYPRMTMPPAIVTQQPGLAPLPYGNPVARPRRQRSGLSIQTRIWLALIIIIVIFGVAVLIGLAAAAGAPPPPVAP